MWYLPVLVCQAFLKTINLSYDCRYYSREDAQNALWYINGTRLDDRVIRTDWDAGFEEGRQYGRGRSGGQVKLAWSFTYRNDDDNSNDNHHHLFCLKS